VKIKNQINLFPYSLFFCLILFLTCFKPPQLPEWDTEVNIPLVTRRFLVKDFIDQKRFRINSDSSIEYFRVFKMETTLVYNKLNFSTVPQTETLKLSQFSFGNFSGKITIPLSAILGISLPEDPTPLPVPPLQKTLWLNLLLPDIQELAVQKGELSLAVINSTPITFDRIRISGGFFSDFILTELIGGGRVEAQKELAEGNIESPSPLTLNIFKEEGETLLLSVRDSLFLNFRIKKVKITSGILQPNKDHNITCEDSLFFTLEEDLHCEWMKINSAKIYLSIFSHFPFPLNASLSLPEIGKEMEITLPPSSPISEEIELGSVELTNRSNQGFLIRTVWRMRADEAQFFLLNATTYLSLFFYLDNLRPTSFAGEFRRPRYLNSAAESILSFLPGDPTGIKVKSASLNFHIVNRTGFSGVVNLTIWARNRHGHCESLSTEIPLNQNREVNSAVRIEQLLNIGPKVVKFFWGLRIFGPGVFSQEDFVCGDILFSLPLQIAFSPDTIYAYSFPVKLAEETREKIKRGIVEGGVTILLNNHLPLGIGASLILMGDPSPYPEGRGKDSLAFPIFIPPGKRGIDGFCERESDTTLTLAVSEENTPLFLAPEITSCLRLEFPASETVTVKTTDYLQFKSYATLRIRAKFN